MLLQFYMRVTNQQILVHFVTPKFGVSVSDANMEHQNYHYLQNNFCRAILQIPRQVCMLHLHFHPQVFWVFLLLSRIVQCKAVYLLQHQLYLLYCFLLLLFLCAKGVFASKYARVNQPLVPPPKTHILRVYCMMCSDFPYYKYS